MSDTGFFFGQEFLVFCRVGAFLLAAPVLASPHVSATVRLFLALGLALSIAPLAGIGPSEEINEGGSFYLVVSSEVLIGTAMGLAARILVSGVYLAGLVISQASGFSGGAVVDDGSGDLTSELGALISATVLALLFVMDFHTALINALIASYDALPVGTLFEPQRALDSLGRAVSMAWRFATGAIGPLIVIGVVLNFAFGIVNRIAPQVPVIFISTPFLLAATLWILLRGASDLSATLAAVIMKSLAWIR